MGQGETCLSFVGRTLLTRYVLANPLFPIPAVAIFSPMGGEKRHERPAADRLRR